MSYFVDVFKGGVLWNTIETLAADALDAIDTVEASLIRAGVVKAQVLTMTDRNGQSKKVVWTGLIFEARQKGVIA